MVDIRKSKLVGGLEHEWILTFHILGISSSQLTFSHIFERGRSVYHQPVLLWIVDRGIKQIILAYDCEMIVNYDIMKGTWLVISIYIYNIYNISTIYIYIYIYRHIQIHYTI